MTSDLYALIRQHVAEKHQMGLPFVVVSKLRHGAEIEGFDTRAAADARMAEPGAIRTLHTDRKNEEHAAQLGRAVDSEFASL